MIDRDSFYGRALLHRPDIVSVSAREIEYRDLTPRKIEVQIPLWEYFERAKRFKATRWQRDLCDRLQDAVVNRYIRQYLGIIHCEGQAGKTTIISQWIFSLYLLDSVQLINFAKILKANLMSKKRRSIK